MFWSCNQKNGLSCMIRFLSGKFKECAKNTHRIPRTSSSLVSVVEEAMTLARKVRVHTVVLLVSVVAKSVLCVRCIRCLKQRVNSLTRSLCTSRISVCYRLVVLTLESAQSSNFNEFFFLKTYIEGDGMFWNRQ